MNRRRWLMAALLLLVIIFIGIFVLIRQPVPKLTGIMFINRQEYGMPHSYWFNLDTQELSPFQNAVTLSQPDVSPEGDEVVYSAFPGLYIYDLKQNTARQITDAERDSQAQWSPDGNSIIFVRNSKFFSALFRYDVLSGESQQLTEYQNDLEPDWSPDGQRVVFTTSRDGFQELYTMRPDGTDLQRLTNNVGQNDLRATYSPDGQQIAYMTNYSVGDGTGEIWLMNADGTDQRPITDNDRDDREPIWSPDGRYIAFTGMTVKSDSDIFVYDVLKGQLRQVTSLPTIDANPVWSPDGKWIAFVSYTSNGQQSQIYAVQPNGSHLQPLVDEYRGYSLSLWMPSS